MNSQGIYTDLESHLQDFIQWAFHQSHSNHYSNTAALTLLGQARKAQRLLWQLQLYKSQLPR